MTFYQSGFPWLLCRKYLITLSFFNLSLLYFFIINHHLFFISFSLFLLLYYLLPSKSGIWTSRQRETLFLLIAVMTVSEQCLLMTVDDQYFCQMNEWVTRAWSTLWMNTARDCIYSHIWFSYVIEEYFQFLKLGSLKAIYIWLDCQKY